MKTIIALNKIKFLFFVPVIGWIILIACVIINFLRLKNYKAPIVFMFFNILVSIFFIVVSMILFNRYGDSLNKTLVIHFLESIVVFIYAAVLYAYQKNYLNRLE